MASAPQPPSLVDIGAVLREIGRGRDGARSMSGEQAFEVLRAVLAGRVGELQLGAFCAAMRIKGESVEETGGFLRAVRDAQQRAGTLLADDGQIPIVLPSYNGSRRLPVLTPLLALLLARRGLPVLVHGMPTEDARVHAFEVFARLGRLPDPDAAGAAPPRPGAVMLRTTGQLLPGLARLLDLRRVLGLRNSAHSLVKLWNPCAGRALVVGSYTHPEYARSMKAVFEHMHADAMLLRGTEGEPVADARRMPAIDAFSGGIGVRLCEPDGGSLAAPPALPAADATSTARWTEAVLAGAQPLPRPVGAQVELLVRWHRQLRDARASQPMPATS